MPLPLFSGEYLSTIDDKNRIIIPAKVRQAAGPDGELGYYVTRGIDECISIQTARRFEETSSAAADDKSRQTAAGRMLERLRLSQAEFGKCDRQGRFLLPARLIESLHIGKNVIIAGVNDRVEVWDAERWKQALKEAEQQLQQGAEKLYGQSD